MSVPSWAFLFEISPEKGAQTTPAPGVLTPAASGVPRLGLDLKGKLPGGVAVLAWGREAQEASREVMLRVLGAGLELIALETLGVDAGLGVELAAAEDALQAWSQRGASLVLTVGGAGLGPDDPIPDITHRVIQRHAPGLVAAVVRGTRDPLYRGIAGLAPGGTVLINLPGDAAAAVRHLDGVLPAVASTTTT